MIEARKQERAGGRGQGERKEKVIALLRSRSIDDNEMDSKQ